MSDKYRTQWERLGDSDPYWAVLTNPDKKGNNWDSAEFFRTGETEIENVISKLTELGTEMRFGVALDFGCGVGRLSRALANRFERVLAVDVSSSMLDEARRANRHVENIEFLHNTAVDLAMIPSHTVDFVYSNIVLQHMPCERQVIFVREFCRVLRAGAILVFQTPSASNLGAVTGWMHMLVGNRLLNIFRRVKYGADGVMELHTLAQKRVLKILSQAGMRLIQVERYDSAGACLKSYMYYARKDSEALSREGNGLAFGVGSAQQPEV